MVGGLIQGAPEEHGAVVMDGMFGKDRLRLLLDQFGVMGDPREACKVKYPLREVLVLVTCASVAG